MDKVWTRFNFSHRFYQDSNDKICKQIFDYQYIMFLLFKYIHGQTIDKCKY